MKCVVECITIKGKIVEKHLKRVQDDEAAKLVGSDKGSIWRYTNKAKWKTYKKSGKKSKSKTDIRPELCREPEKKRFVHGT